MPPQAPSDIINAPPYRIAPLDSSNEDDVIDLKYKFNNQLLNLQDALRHRAVSFEADEPLCIATMLSLDMQSIIQVQPDMDIRMQQVWKSVEKS